MSNQYLDPNLKVFSLNSNFGLAQEIAASNWSGTWKMYCNEFQ